MFEDLQEHWNVLDDGHDTWKEKTCEALENKTASKHVNFQTSYEDLDNMHEDTTARFRHVQAL